MLLFTLNIPRMLCTILILVVFFRIRGPEYCLKVNSVYSFNLLTNT